MPATLAQEQTAATASPKEEMTYGELKALDAPYPISHAIDVFCSNARFHNKEGWRDDAVRAPEMEIIKRWASSNFSGTWSGYPIALTTWNLLP